MEKVAINPSSLFDSRQYGFSQLVVASPGKHVFISGQVAWDENQNIVGKGDLEKQCSMAFKNLSLAIEEAGGSVTDIVMLRLYLVNYQKEDSRIISKSLSETFGTETPPASTWINVQGLANEEFLIEVEAQAII